MLNNSSSKPSSKNSIDNWFFMWLRRFLIFWTLLLTTLMSTGTFTQAHIGSITWGPTTDLWAMSIAVSKIKYNLKGGLGYKAVSNEMNKYLTSTQSDLNVGDLLTATLDDNPKNITRALNAATHLSKADLPSHKHIDLGHFREQYVTTQLEDIGYADFYNIAFRLFGFHALSTHYFYFTLLFLSLALYFLAFHQSPSATILITLLISALFLIATSTAMFCVSTPTFAANRFLSTLALFPFLHCIIYIFQTTPQTRLDKIYLLLQILLLAFTLNLRSSATWIVVAYLVILGGTMFLRHYKPFAFQKNSRLYPMIAAHGKKRIKMAFFIFVIALTVYDVSRSLTLHKVYYSDDIMPHHVFWHSAFLGLTYHPDWDKKMPYRDQLKNCNGDGIAWKLYELYMKKDPQHYQLSPLTGNYKIRIHEKIVRKEFLKFAFYNPSYMFELFFYYKPYKIFLYIKNTLGGLTAIPLLLALLSLLGSFFLSIKKNSTL